METIIGSAVGALIAAVGAVLAAYIAKQSAAPAPNRTPTKADSEPLPTQKQTSVPNNQSGGSVSEREAYLEELRRLMPDSEGRRIMESCTTASVAQFVTRLNAAIVSRHYLNWLLAKLWSLAIATGFLGGLTVFMLAKSSETERYAFPIGIAFVGVLQFVNWALFAAYKVRSELVTVHIKG